MDRTVNELRYPKLTYPEVYILEGGYSMFFEEFRSRCYPQNYVEMSSKEHSDKCERELGKLRQRTKLNRAQTFAFGQREELSSPTQPGRPRDDSVMSGMMGGLEDAFGSPPRLHAKRMASY